MYDVPACVYERAGDGKFIAAKWKTKSNQINNGAL
jgi:hypothetical protein